MNDPILDAFWWLALLVTFIFTLVGVAAIVEFIDSKNPYFQARKREKANERFKEIVSGK